MTGFLAGAVALMLLTVGVLAWPLLRRTTASEASSAPLNAAVYRDKLAELEQDLASGSLSQVDYEQSRTELQRRLLDDSAAAGSEVATPAVAPKSKGLLIGLMMGLPIVAMGLYVAIGNPAALQAQAANPHPQGVTNADIEKMVTGLAAKLDKEPDNHRGWAMLARSYKTLGRYDEAVKAYAHAGPLLDDSPDLLVDYADAVASAAQGFNEQSRQLLAKALQLDPNHAQGLWMRGSASFDAGRYDLAIADWEKLLAQLPAESEEAQAMRGNIAEARKRAGGK